VVTDAASGRFARLVANDLLRRLAEAAPLPFRWQSRAVSEILDDARARNDESRLALWAGQSAGLVDDLPTAAEVLARLIPRSVE
jgi:NAD(P)H-dependent flavin oxidoreductase YrpB (nitropropane dioxygenase family)